MKLRVVLPWFPWWRCLEDLAGSIFCALRDDGGYVTHSDRFASDGAIPVVLGAHHPAVEIPDGPFVIYQTEPPGTGSWWDDSTDAGRKFREKLNRATAVWDCSPHYKTPCDEAKRATVLPGYYFAAAADAKSVPKDIDILFYGSLSERRQQMLERLADAGLKPSVHFGVFGETRNALIDRAKLVLDIKQRETDPSDESRNFFLDSRGACVLSENDPDKRRVLIPDRIVQQCKGLLASDGMRKYHAQSRRDDLKPTDVSDGIAVLKRRLESGSGKRWSGTLPEHGTYEGVSW